jgi:hypothetical protein
VFLGFRERVLIQRSLPPPGSLRARPALGVSLGEQQSHYCDTEQNKTDRAHGFFLPVLAAVIKTIGIVDVAALGKLAPLAGGPTRRRPQRPIFRLWLREAG